MQRKEVTAADGQVYELSWSGGTVWLNHPEGNVARFSLRAGIDIHSFPMAQDKGLCEDCSHEPDWERFTKGVLDKFKVTIPDEVFEQLGGGDA